MALRSQTQAHRELGRPLLHNTPLPLILIIDREGLAVSVLFKDHL